MIRQLGRFDFDQKYLTANQRKQGRLYTGRAYGDDGACWHIAWRIGSRNFLLPEVVGMNPSDPNARTAENSALNPESYANRD